MVNHMMKILVFSDSHGVLSCMEKAVKREKPDHILHLGDCIRDARSLRTGGIPITMVPGNCDWSREPAVQTLELAGVRIFMTHGHLHGVKLHYQRLIYAALEAEAQVALFGHTHRAECFVERGIRLMNPGPCQKGGSYGIITLQDGDITYALRVTE